MLPDSLTLTVRLHDPAEKTHAHKSTAWEVLEIPRQDLQLPRTEFFEKHVTPALNKIIERLLAEVEAPA
jgi:hypothetical protein